MLWISTRAGCPAEGRLGRTWTKWPPGPKRAQRWGMVNFSGVAGRGGARRKTQVRLRGWEQRVSIMSRVDLFYPCSAELCCCIHHYSQNAKRRIQITLLRGIPGGVCGVLRRIEVEVLGSISLVWVLSIGVVHSQSRCSGVIDCGHQVRLASVQLALQGWKKKKNNYRQETNKQKTNTHIFEHILDQSQSLSREQFHFLVSE